MAVRILRTDPDSFSISGRSLYAADEPYVRNHNVFPDDIHDF